MTLHAPQTEDRKQEVFEKALGLFESTIEFKTCYPFCSRGEEIRNKAKISEIEKQVRVLEAEDKDSVDEAREVLAMRKYDC